MKYRLLFAFFLINVLISINAFSETGYRLWQRYDLVQDEKKLKDYQSAIEEIVFEGNSEILSSAKNELRLGLEGLLGKPVTISSKNNQKNVLIAGTPANSPIINSLVKAEKLKDLGAEGYLLETLSNGGKKYIIIAANSDTGILYGTFHFLRLLQTHETINTLHIKSVPKTSHRILNHWDNLDRTVERGYAGFSLWNWHKLPDHIDPRYIDYARANASIGINGTVLTNVNANALILTEEFLTKVAALADAFRPYGLKVYLTARFSAPVEIGGLKTADPLDPEVKNWWNKKVNEIYKHVPDFGGFLVKANSEGQPGPQNYDRNHADGANMLAEAVKPHGGIVMWRAFVYDDKVPDDRAKQAYNEFTPLDGKFQDNVMIQVKNGPIDFQPREPFHPLFGAMPETPLMMEFQITQEYLGFSTHLAYLAPLFKETLDSDTYAQGPGSTVAKVVTGELDNHKLSGMAGVTNIGNDINWTGHPFGQANWYSFGRIAWDHTLSSENIADEWIKMTFTNKPQSVKQVKEMMMKSREAVVDYMMPLGLHHLFDWGHHYGPGPWIKDRSRADWTSVYYHQADSSGVGFDRTSSGSNALEQYHPKVQEKYGDPEKCPEEFLLWFHHVSWDHEMNSGRTLWNELVHHYYNGVESVREMQNTWEKQKGIIDKERFEEVKSLLKIQEKEAVWWRNACVLYFQTFSGKPIPDGLEKPMNTLEFYENQKFNFVPGN